MGEVFALPTFDADGSRKGIDLDVAGLSWSSRNGPRQRSFYAIATIDLGLEPGGEYPHARCDINFSDGERLRIEITNDNRHGADILAYRAFLVDFFDKLGPVHRARIVFNHGPSPLKRMVWIILSGSLLALCIGFLIFALLFANLRQDNSWLLVPLMLMFVVMMTAALQASIRIRQQTFDPMTVPEGALPALPKT